MGKPVYLDYNATTPIDPAVREVMLPYLGEYFGNPSTTHAYGQPAKEAVERARQRVASLIGAALDEVIFTSGGSESDNHAIIGTALANSYRGKHIITMSIEHPAVLNTCRYLEKRLGFKVTYVPVDKHGLVDPEDIRQAVEEIGEIAREQGILFHTDAAQSCGKIRVDVNELKVDLLTIAGHKLYAPKGIGALFIRKGFQIDSLIHGASQEKGMRAGTENVPYTVGLGKACELAGQALSEFGTNVKGLRDRLYQIIVDGLGTDRVHLNGHPERRLPNTLNISIRGIVGDELLSRIPEMAASTGAACHAGSTEPSSVLLEMGLSRELALGALRLTLGRWSTLEEIDIAAKLIVKQVKRILQSA